MERISLADVSEQIAQLATASKMELKDAWVELFNAALPSAYGRGSLERAIAYRLQEKVYGRLPKAELRRIKTLREMDEIKEGIGPELDLHEGTVLSRTWHGQVHQVIVRAKGYQYRSRDYDSLSQIAREITGTRWSGPRFFGLKSSRHK